MWASRCSSRRVGHEPVTCGGHRVGNGVERRRTVAAVLDDVLPPSFRVGVTGRRGEFAQRVGRCRLGDERGVVISDRGERDRERQVDRVDLDVVLVGPGDRLPFGAERGERCERSPARLGGNVGEQCDRRHEAGLAHPAQRSVDVGGCFDEDDVGPDFVERPQHRAGRPGSVVADAEQVDGHEGDTSPSGSGLTCRGATGVVEVVPAGTFADDGFEVLAPGDRVVDRIADDGADDAGGDVGRAQFPVAEVGGEREAVGDDRDRLGGRQRAGGDLDAVAFVLGEPRSQFAEHGDDATDLVGSGGHVGQGEGDAEFADAAADDGDLLVDGGRQAAARRC